MYKLLVASRKLSSNSVSCSEWLAFSKLYLIEMRRLRCDWIAVHVIWNVKLYGFCGRVVPLRKQCLSECSCGVWPNIVRGNCDALDALVISFLWYVYAASRVGNCPPTLLLEVIGACSRFSKSCRVTKDDLSLFSSAILKQQRWRAVRNLLNELLFLNVRSSWP